MARIIYQGDLFWIRPDGEAISAELGQFPHPYVVVQDDLFNHSRIHTTVVCALTTNLKQAQLPGSVMLNAGEANLPQQSVVVVSKISAVAKEQLGDHIGRLSQARIDQILAGLRFLQRGYFKRPQ